MLLSLLSAAIILGVLFRTGLIVKVFPVALFVAAACLFSGLVINILAATWLPLVLAIGACVAVFHK